MKSSTLTSNKTGISWTYENSPELVKAYSLRLTNRRRRLGLSQRDLSKMVGVSVNTIQSYESGCLPRGEHFLNLACALNCSLDWLVGLEGGGLSWPTAMENDDYSGVGQKTQSWELPRSWVYPQYLVENSADQDQSSISPISFDKHWLSNIIPDTNMAKLIVVKGPAMNPTFYDGDILLIDSAQKQIHQGQAYAIDIENRYMINRLEARPGGIIRVVSDNREIAPPYEVSENQVNILGQVVWKGRFTR